MSGDPGSVTNSVREQVLRFLHFEPETRRHVVRWAVNQEVNYGEAFVKAATSVFDVMRSLPYTDDELAVAIGTCAGLLTANEQWSGDFWQRARAVSALFFGSDSIEVEIAIATDTLAYTRAIVGRKDLLSAFRDDLWTFFTEQGKARYTQDPQYLLSSFGIPDALFPFDRFRRLLYSQVVPTQAVWRPDLPLIASPTRVFKLGLP